MSAKSSFTTRKTNTVRPKTLQSFKTEASPGTEREHRSFVGDRFQNRFNSTKNSFEEKKHQTSAVNVGASPPYPSSPVTERIQPFSALRQRFEADVNNNISPPSQRGTRHTSSSFGNIRPSWTSELSPSSSRRSSGSSTDFNQRSNDLSVIREKIVVAKQELARANERREVAKHAYSEAKYRINSSKSQSKLLRDQIRSKEEILARKEKKLEDATKRLAARSIVIDQERRAARFYEKDIAHESEMVDQLSEKIEVTRAKRKETLQRMRYLTQNIPPIQTAIERAETSLDEARKRSRRFEQILTKSTIRLKNARALSEGALKRTSFRGLEIEDVREKISEQKERLQKARSDIQFAEYRKQLLTEQLGDIRTDIRSIVLRLNPHHQQKALGFVYTRLPMSEEL